MHDTYIEHIDKVIIEKADTGMIKFDEEGTHFAYMVPTNNNDGTEPIYMINVIKISEKKKGDDLLKAIQDEDFCCRFSSRESFDSD